MDYRDKYLPQLQIVRNNGFSGMAFHKVKNLNKGEGQFKIEKRKVMLAGPLQPLSLKSPYQLTLRHL